MRTSAACATGIMCRMRSCRIERPKQTASPACRPPRSRPSCATASAGTLQQWVMGSLRRLPADRDLIERHVARVIAKPQALEVCLIPTCMAENHGRDDLAPCHPPTHDHASLDRAKLCGREGHCSSFSLAPRVTLPTSRFFPPCKVWFATKGSMRRSSVLPRRDGRSTKFEPRGDNHIDRQHELARNAPHPTTRKRPQLPG